MLVKLQRAAFSAIIWFGDLNALALRQLLILGLDLPDTQAGAVLTERGSQGGIATAGCCYSMLIPRHLLLSFPIGEKHG